MKIRLLDYADKEHFVDIPDDTEEIIINIISGDMVMISPIYYDTSDSRLINFNDGTIVLKKDEFWKLNEITSTYDIYETLDSKR